MASTIVLITGANSGVGYAASEAIAKASAAYHVIMTGRSLKKVEKAKEEIEASSIQGQLSALQLDVTDEQSVERAAATVEDRFGQLDVLINNAAVGASDDNIKTRYQRAMETNVIGPAVVSAAFRPLLLKSTNPYSIYISSGAGSLTKAADPTPSPFKEPANGGAYKVSKAALNMLALLEWREFGAAGLKVFIISPGFVITNLRGPNEEARTGWGLAKSADGAGDFILSIIEGHRDADVGKFIREEGPIPW